MHKPLLTVAAVGMLFASASAQFTHTIPAGTDVAAGNGSNAFPFGSAAAAWPGLRLMAVYDAVNFTGAAQPITGPILISRLKWRANDGTQSWTGGTFTTATIELSTAAVTSTTVTTNFATNHGADRAVVYQGPVTVLPGTGAGAGVVPPYVVDIQLATPFLYDPNQGSLCIDVDYPGAANFVGGSLTQMDVQSTGSNAARIFASSLYPAANGTTANHGPVVELEYLPPAGLYSAFSATPDTGMSPLTVQFTDLTFTSDPGGVTSWAWDFDNDGVVDSTAQNPTHTYNNCGTYTVSLTTTDSLNAPSTLTRTNLITTDVVDADFTFTVIAPGIVQFTDTTAPAATSWAWDFDGDGVTDSTLQNPVHVYVGGGLVNVSLTASRLCGPADSKTQQLIPTPHILTTFAGGNGLSASGSGNAFDVNVTNPNGITITDIVMSPWVVTPGPFTIDVYMTEDDSGYSTAVPQAALWRHVASGAATTTVTATSSSPTPVNFTLAERLHIAPGNYSMAIHVTGGGVVYTTGNGTNQVYSNADLAITCGGGLGSLFPSSFNNPRVWNGALIYDDCGTGGLAGYGYLGNGCAGSSGVSTLSPTGAPTLGGTMTIDVDNLPLNVAVMCLGLSSTVSVFGPLPVDLTVFGAAGCFGLVSPDANSVLIGAGGTATYSLTLPNSPSLICTKIFNQAFVIDPAANALGGVMSDAGAGIVGN
jgi:PKD repeat protein